MQHVHHCTDLGGGETLKHHRVWMLRHQAFHLVQVAFRVLKATEAVDFHQLAHLRRGEADARQRWDLVPNNWHWRHRLAEPRVVAFDDTKRLCAAYVRRHGADRCGADGFCVQCEVHSNR